MPTVAKGTQPPEDAASIEERMRQVNKSLSASYKQLNEYWETIENKLKKMVPPRYVWISYESWDDDMHQPQAQFHNCLGLVKYRGEWRICHGHYYDMHEGSPDSWKPISECSVEERVGTVDHIDKLREKILEVAEKSIPEVEKAVAKLAKTSERF